MVSWILILSTIAVVFYVLIPVLSMTLAQKRDTLVLERLRSASCFSATITGVSRNTMSIQPDKIEQDTDDEESIVLQIQKTTFFALNLDGRLERLRWGDFVACKTGGTVMIYLPDSGTKRIFCVFHEERNRKAYEARINRAVPVTRNPVKPYSIAAGVFFEFIIFLHALHYPEMTPIALLALIAIFGKALPYCPPGLLLTWIGHHITRNSGKKDKKSRQRGTVGIMIYTAGILLNIAMLLFVISSTGLGRFGR